ncbi:MAG TPA: malic enzyme-like NAD(P)-binding protein [Spirochaetota bacterium]|nr:malic enzyme-like NAD(P)-binding protein [Spirochaetota bacterium]
MKKLPNSAQYSLAFNVDAGQSDLKVFKDVIAKAGGFISNITEKQDGTCIYEVDNSGPVHAAQLQKRVAAADIRIIAVWDVTFKLHEEGKLITESKSPLCNASDLSRAYTPGVARVCMDIKDNPRHVYKYTIKNNTVAVVSDGTAVLGLGDIGPEAAMPVMEGKAQLFHEFAGLNAFPVCLDTKDPDAIIAAVRHIAPGFGGINLEDIAAPRCFAIEKALIEELDIPVFHDDQHGTAVVLTAGVLNALRINGKKPQNLKAVVCGVGAAGTSCTAMLIKLGVENIIGCDRKGILYKGRPGMNEVKERYAAMTNPDNIKGDLFKALSGADLFVGLSGPDLLHGEDLKLMRKNPMIFAMSNPVPEIMPEEARPYAEIIATGRSDYPNQLNNVLCFPGLFKGALQVKARKISEKMKMAAAEAISKCVADRELRSDYIIPDVFNRNVVPAVARAVAETARTEKLARMV